MFGYTRRDSMTDVFLELSLPALDTIVHNNLVFCCKSVSEVVQQDCTMVFNYMCVVVFYLSFIFL